MHFYRNGCNDGCKFCKCFLIGAFLGLSRILEVFLDMSWWCWCRFWPLFFFRTSGTDPYTRLRRADLNSPLPAHGCKVLAKELFRGLVIMKNKPMAWEIAPWNRAFVEKKLPRPAKTEFRSAHRRCVYGSVLLIRESNRKIERKIKKHIYIERERERNKGGGKKKKKYIYIYM